MKNKEYRRIPIEVTEDNIYSGVEGCSFSCPIALAISDKLDREKWYTDDYRINVQPKLITLINDVDKKIIELYVIPHEIDEVVDFIEAFDSGYDVEHFSFDLLFKEADIQTYFN